MEVFLTSCLTVDEYIYKYKTGQTFQVSLKDDRSAWRRASAYLAQRPGIEIKVTSDNLIETSKPIDTISIGYALRRIPAFDRVQYEIICSTQKRNFDPDEATRLLSFYMITRRDYGS